MDDVGQPVQRKHTLLRLQRRPREHSQRYRIDAGLFHQRNILCQNVRPVKPLLRVIVPAMKQLKPLHHRSSLNCANCATFLLNKVAFDTEYSKNARKMQCGFMAFC